MPDNLLKYRISRAPSSRWRAGDMVNVVSARPQQPALVGLSNGGRTVADPELVVDVQQVGLHVASLTNNLAAT